MRPRRFDSKRRRPWFPFFSLVLASCGPPQSEVFPSKPTVLSLTTIPTSTQRRPVQTAYASRDVLSLEPSIAEFARLRGLNPPFRPVLLRIPRSGLASLFRKELTTRNAHAQSRPLEFIYQSWGLLPEGYRTETQVLAHFSRTVEGVYLSSATAIVLPSDRDPNSPDGPLLHETVHAYQDARFRLGERLKYERGRGDELSALHAFAEGEALLVEGLSRNDRDETPLPSVEETSSRLLKALSKTSLAPIERLSLVAPYIDGYRFARELFETGGFSLIDRVWARGLPSTQVLLHPERWLKAFCVGDDSALVAKVHVVAAPPQPNPLSRLVFEDPLGEQGLRILLELSEREPDARQLASTYRDDRLVLFESPEARDVFWHLRLDRPEDARAIRPTLERLLGPVTQRSRTGDCVQSDHALLAMRDSRRDIYVSTRVQTDTWTAPEREEACDDLVEWLARAEAETLSSH